MKGCKYVLHIASPLQPSIPKNPDEVIRPAVDGVINVLSACAESGSVKRVVVTGSSVAISCGLVGHPNRQDHTYTEEDWSPPEACSSPYDRSKTLAEMAAWDFIKDLPDKKKFELSVINPVIILGPIITKTSAGTSVGFIKSYLSGKLPGFVDLLLPLIDVRDVACANITIMEKPKCNGKRYILAVKNNVPFQTVCEVLNREFFPQGYKSVTWKIPKFIAWIVSKFNDEMSIIYPGIGKKMTFVNDRMVNELEIQPRTIEETLIDTAYSLIEFGLVKKTSQYHGPGSKLMQAGEPGSSSDDKQAEPLTQKTDESQTQKDEA